VGNRNLPTRLLDKRINADAFDPRVHEMYDDRAQQSPVKAKVGKSKPDAEPQ
jgi:hypothetical protein